MDLKLQNLEVNLEKEYFWSLLWRWWVMLSEEGAKAFCGGTWGTCNLEKRHNLIDGERQFPALVPWIWSSLLREGRLTPLLIILNGTTLGGPSAWLEPFIPNCKALPFVFSELILSPIFPFHFIYFSLFHLLLRWFSFYCILIWIFFNSFIGV